MNRRLVFVWAFAPMAAFYAWACSSDDAAAPPIEEDGGSSTSSSSSASSSSSGGSSTSSSGGPTDGGDAGDAGNPLTCVGNPLTADGGTPDGGAILSADAGGVVRQALMTADTFIDGPVYTELFTGGALVYSEVFGIGHRVMRTGPDGGTPSFVINSPGAGANQTLPTGNAVKGDFILTTVVAQGVTDSQIIQTRADGGAGAAITFPAGLNIDDPNDLVVNKAGTIYFTDPAYQSGVAENGVYRVATDGGVSLVKAYSANVGDKPDGIALSPDEKTLYVAFGLNQRIDRFTLDANGNATAVAQPFGATFTDLPEGIATDSGGNLWVAESNAVDTTNGGRVSVWDPAGKKWGEIRFPNHRPIGVAFGGSADNKALYILANQYTGAGTSNFDAYVFIYNMRCAGVR